MLSIDYVIKEEEKGTGLKSNELPELKFLLLIIEKGVADGKLDGYVSFITSDRDGKTRYPIKNISKLFPCFKEAENSDEMEVTYILDLHKKVQDILYSVTFKNGNNANIRIFIHAERKEK